MKPLNAASILALSIGGAASAVLEPSNIARRNGIARVLFCSRRAISTSNSATTIQTFIAPPPPPPPELGVGVVAGGSGVAAGGGVGVELVGGVGFPATEMAALSAPTASTRPKPKVPSGATLLNRVAPFV